jgi:glycosyltransferase involved in cell wall biosynthesis
MTTAAVGTKKAFLKRRPPDIKAITSSSACQIGACRRDGTLARVDVIIPCYNYGRFLEQCVNSVLRQVGVDVRVLVIDDASPDNTAEVAAALARENSTNKGHIDTYNEGIEWVSAEYMLLLSADDYLLPGALARATDLMDAHPEVGFTFGNVVELSDSGNETLTKSVIKPTNNSDKRILEGRELIEVTGAEGNQVTTCSAVVRTVLQKRLGGYRQELPHAGDMEMWLRFAAHASVGFIFSLQGVYRRHSTSMSAAYYLASDDGQIYRKNGRLGALRQQKLAFDFFFEHCKDVMPRYEHLCRRIYRQLAESFVSQASAAFNDGEMEESRQLSDFALAICPEVKSSSAWLKLTFKRWMGARTWRAVRPAAAVIRAMQRNLEHASVGLNRGGSQRFVNERVWRH